jgi:leucyl-tRNA synthetase
MTLMNHVSKFDDKSPQGRAVEHEALVAAVLMMAPITPHICDQLWSSLCGTTRESARWLKVDKSALTKSSVELIVQVNGKLRGKFEIPIDAPREDVEALARQDDNVGRYLDGKTERKIIYVENKLINFVVS